MTIRIKLLFSILATAILIFIVCLVVYQRTQQINKEIKKTEVAQEIIQAATTRRGLVFDYSRYHEERPKAQWQSLLSAQTILTHSELFDTPDEQSVLTQINETSEQVKSIFAELVANYEKPKSSQAELVLSLELEQVLVSQLLIKAQANINRAYTLSDASLAKINTAQRTLVFAAGVSMAVLLFFLVALFFFFNKFIAKPLLEFTEAALDVASLDFSTTTTTTTTTNRKDELGMLSRAFNTMVVKLKESYATLEQKVVERTAKLTEKTQEAEDSQKAVMNVLEDLKIKEEKLVEARAKDEAMLASIGDAVIATDKDGMVIVMNKIAEDILGLTRIDILGKSFIHEVSQEDVQGNKIPDKLRPITLALRSRKTTTATTFQFVRKDGSKVPVAITVTPVIIDSKTIGAILVFRDITKEKEIDKAKTEFVSLASHQLRTPLTTISWYSEMILNGDVGKVMKKQKKYLEEIYQGNQRMVELVNTLLNVSRLELGTFKVELEPTDVALLVRSVVDEQRPQIDKKKLKLNEKYADNLPKLNADPKILRIVFQNLLSNAIKYTQGKGIVTIDLRLVKRGESVDKQKANEDSIAIIVSDTGVGIPKNQQDKIFTKLFRADNVREQDTEGTGLGLYIVKSVVENSGGKIWFESPYFVETSKGKEEIQGTTFYVTLPLADMKKKEGTKALG